MNASDKSCVFIKAGNCRSFVSPFGSLDGGDSWDALEPNDSIALLER